MGPFPFAFRPASSTSPVRSANKPRPGFVRVPSTCHLDTTPQARYPEDNNIFISTLQAREANVMERHVLLTIGTETSNHPPLRFLHTYFEKPAAIRTTLFYVTPQVMAGADSYSALPESEAQSPAEALAKKSGQQTLEHARKWMMDVGGWSKEMIGTKVDSAGRGKVRSIVDEAIRGLYDAVLFGRRGLTRLDELFAQSVTSDMLWQAMDFPIWICRGTETETQRNMLLCVDGSAPAMRMADHVGFMLADEPHPITLFHVERPGGTGLDEGHEKIMSEATRQLVDNGVSEDRIHVKLARTNDVAQAIMTEAGRGDYGVVAVGRRNDKPSALSKFFHDSVCRKLITSLEDRTLWISK